MRLSALNEQDQKKLISLRRWLHAHPEVSRKEYKTAEYVRNFLNQNAAPDEVVDLAGAGFAVVYNGKNPGKTVMLRCELDALPIHEVNEDLPYRSVYDGVGHKCGHDGHMTILCGIAMILSYQRPQSGRVVLLFQPDEETGTGARDSVNHPDFKKIEPDYAFALHNFPGFPRNQIICRPGTMLSAVKFVAVKFHGKECHSAMPETGKNPAMAIAEITRAARELQNRFDKENEYALVVPIYYEMGVSSSGVSPGYGEAHFTIRTCRNKVVDEMWTEFQSITQEISTKHELEIEFEILENFAATENYGEAVSLIENVAMENAFGYTTLEKPFRVGEDFGEILKLYNGALFGLGAGEDMPELHNPDYDFPEEIIPSGIAMFRTLIERVLTGETCNDDISFAAE